MNHQHILHIYTRAMLLSSILFVLWKPLSGQNISIDKDSLDFGNVAQGTVAAFTLTVTNDSDGILKAGFRPSCDCISVKPERVSIEPRQHTIVNVTVDTKGYMDAFSGTIYVQSNDADNPYFTVTVKGAITAPEVPREKSEPEKKPQIPLPQLERQAALINVAIFASASCSYCITLKQSIIPALEKKYGVQIAIDSFDLDLPRNFEILSAIEKSRNMPFNKVPVVFVGSDILAGKNEINASIGALVEKYGQRGGAKKIELPAIENRGTGETAVEKLTIMPVIAAGLIDSINPCAFATLIFFISYLGLVLKKNRFEIAAAGFVFISGVFTTYFLIGLGIFGTLRTLTGFTFVSKIVYALTGLFALALGLRHGYEAVLIEKTGDIENSIRLKLPGVIRTRLYDTIKKFSSFRYLVPIAFALASVVTLLELFCTGQVYLPTIMYLLSLRQYRSTATAYLALYCLLFVVPLIAVFTLYYFGMTTEQLKRFFKNHIVTGKVITAAFFITLALAMFIQL